MGFEPLEGLRWRLWFRDIDLGLIELLPDWFDQAAAERFKVTPEINKKNNVESSKPAA